MRKQMIAGTMALALVLGSMAGCSPDVEPSTTSETNTVAASTESATEDPTNLDLSTENMYDGIEVGTINAGVAVHDPSIIQEDGVYYIFGSHMASAKSENMREWTSIGEGYKSFNPVYENVIGSGTHAFDWAGFNSGEYSVWAPDVIYNEAMGKYVMYFCTSSTYIKSNLCFGISDTIEGPYVWQSAILYSGFTADDIDQTDVLDYVSEEYAAENYLLENGEYNNQVAPNCIDPTVFYDEDGRMWMVYGSWSGGIFLLEIDEETGLPIHPEADEENGVDPYFGKRLIGGGHQSIEAPYILYDANSGYYFLFVSYGSLNREGGYQIRVFRSETPDGEYVDMNGAYPTLGSSNERFGLKLSGNYMLPSLPMAYMATGHNSAFIDDDGKMYVAYHTRFDDGTEGHEPRVKQMFLNEEGWPVILPYATDGETISETGYSVEEIAGVYYFLLQGLDISSIIIEPMKIQLKEDGTVRGISYGKEVTGTWEQKEGSYFMKLNYNKGEYSGVFCKQNDEAGNEVMTFSAVGSNQSAWGIKYLDN